MGTKTQKLSNVVDQIIEWQSVVVADGSTNTTGVSGRGYFVDISAGAHTVNLPASPKIGDIIKVTVITAGNTLTIGRNGNNINGSAVDITTSSDGDTFELVYVNASEGWKTVGQISAGAFISATGGTVTTSGDYKIHTFTGDGSFVVGSTGNIDINPLGGPSTADYLVVAGGGAGGGYGGGGAGGYRESKDSTVSSPHTASPLAATTGITVTATTYPITVGAGGAGNPPTGDPGSNPGSNSIFSTITSSGGGGGNANKPGHPGYGGSGGGGSHDTIGGTGNSPPVSPSQGNPGGDGGSGGGAPAPNYLGGGGGGAGAAGNDATPSGADGGNGVASSISGSSVTRAGGGGGGGYPPMPDTTPSGGSGGGGTGGYGPNPSPVARLGTAGSANTGGGGGASPPNNASGAGGKGIVIIRYKYQ